ncbi:MAG: amidohydrolase [Dehalococcoidia bacterium]|jgi:hypothetical protein|nr:amidohydrolase [Dehalococcoidia bacterium]
MSDTPSIILVNGSIHTVDTDNSIAEAIAIQGDRISLVGSNTDVRAQARSETKVIDLAGRTVTPGFIDAHQHFAGIGAATDAIDCKAPGMNSISALVEEVRKRAATQPEGTWIRGRGYNDSKLTENRHPNAMDWDLVSPNHPVWFTRTCGHIGSFNSAAMRLAEVEKTLDDPDGGRFDRNAAGEIIGVAYERATVPFRDVLQPSKMEIREHLRAANQLDLASGISSVHDAGGMTGLPLEQALDLVALDELQVRIYSFVTVNALDHPHVPILETGIKTGFGNQQIRVGAFKIMTDGSSSGPTAATRSPYAIDSDNSGIAYWSQNELDDLLGRAHRAGWQCTVHAVGDKAIQQTLDAMARAQSEYPRDLLRHRIDHCGITPPDLQDRVVSQMVVPAMQPAFFWEFGDGYIQNYGRDRADVMFPAKSLIERGVRVAGSSDSPVTDYRPLFGIEQAITRATESGDICGPNECVDLTTALRMHTINGAFASFEDDIKGSLEQGKLADLTVLSEKIEDVPVTELRDLPIDITFVGGRIAFER